MDVLSILENIETESYTRKELVCLSKHSDGEVRLRALEELMNTCENFPSLRLLEGLKDDDVLVRVLCLEELGDQGNEAHFCSIYQLIEDNEALVRAAAIVALGQTGSKDDIRRISTIVPQTEAEQLAKRVALYIISDSRYLDGIIHFFNSPDYHIRCSVANQLSQFAKKSDKSLIIHALKTQLVKEKARSVQSSLMNALNEL